MRKQTTEDLGAGLTLGTKHQVFSGHIRRIDSFFDSIFTTFDIYLRVYVQPGWMEANRRSLTDALYTPRYILQIAIE
jgi:hypothetical protein